MTPGVVYAVIAALLILELARTWAANRAAGRKHALAVKALEAKRGGT